VRARNSREAFCSSKVGGCPPVEDEVRRSHRVRPKRGPTQQFMRSLRADATLGGTSWSISPPNVAISLTPLELKKL
jgi:hypothetical protein